MLSLLKNMPIRLLILTIILVIANMGTAASMQIFVDTQDHGTITLEVEPIDQIITVKGLIEDQIGIPAALQILRTESGIVMEDQNRLQDYSVQKEDTIYLEVLAENIPLGSFSLIVLFAGLIFFSLRLRQQGVNR